MFNFDDLTAETRQSVDSELAAISKNETQIIRLKITNGHHLLNVKRLIGHGGWLKWLLDSGRTGYRSSRSAERDMALAEVLYERLDELEDILSDRTSATALYEVVRAGAHVDALDAALTLMQRGLTVTEEDGQKLNFLYDFNPKIADNVRMGDLALQDAFDVAKRLEALEVPEDIESLVVRECVKSPDVVDALVVMRESQFARFEEVWASGHVFNIVAKIEVPLREASVGDLIGVIEHQESESIAAQHEHFQDWKKHRAERLATVEGDLYEVLAALKTALLNKGGTGRYKVYAYPAAVVEQPEVVGVPV